MQFLSTIWEKVQSRKWNCEIALNLICFSLRMCALIKDKASRFSFGIYTNVSESFRAFCSRLLDSQKECGGGEKRFTIILFAILLILGKSFSSIERKNSEEERRMSLKYDFVTDENFKNKLW